MQSKRTIFQAIDFALWSRVHRLPRFFIERWQLRELKRAVAEAYAHVPLYRKLMDERGMKPQDLRSFEDMRRLPITSKRLFRMYPMREAVSDVLPVHDFSWKHTSGSSGEPFEFPWSALSYLLQRFGRICIGFHTSIFLFWQGMSPRNFFDSLKIAEMRVNYRPRSKLFLHIPVSDLCEKPEAVISRLKEFGPDILDSRITALVELARIAAEMPRNERPRFRYLAAHGETVTPAQRKYIKEVFGVEIYERYGLEEMGDVAVDCEQHNGLHVHEESHIVEILDEAGNPLPDGVPGRIVATIFYNDVMPFIRYDTGDQGVMFSERCPCGITARRISVKGRIGGFFSVGQRKFHHVEFEVALAGFSKSILRYQIAKTGENTVELRIIPAETFSQADAESLKDYFNRIFDFTPQVRVVAEIPYTADGKTRFIIDEAIDSR